MSVFQLGDGSTPYADRFSVGGDENEVDLEDFEALDLLDDLDTARLTEALLSDPSEILPQAGSPALTAQSELPLADGRRPLHASLPFETAHATELPASEGTAAQRPAPNLTNAPFLSTGGPYWGAELAWKRSGKNVNERRANDDQGEDEETERSRRRRAAWRKYNETALERRLKGQV